MTALRSARTESNVESRAAGAATTASDATAAVARCARYLQDHAGERTPLKTLAALVGVSAFHLQRIFKREVGLSPREFQDALRQRRFSERLRAGDTVSRATYEAGYGSSSRVYGRAEVRATIASSGRKSRAAEKQIQFSIARVPLGRLLVAFTSNGVCMVELGDSDDTLVSTLHANFENSHISRVPGSANPWISHVATLANGQANSDRIPLDVRGTAFQWKVWRALQRIPSGETRSYSEVAQAIAQPRAVRAVASACARNPVALVVPCHRVVRADGTPGEYRWGKERKAELLRTERKSRGDR